MDDPRNRCPVIKHLSLLFQGVTSPFGQQNGPDIPIQYTSHNPKRDRKLVCQFVENKSIGGGVITYVPIPTTAYVAYHNPPEGFSFGGKKGAASNAMLRRILSITAGNHALYGLLMSGRLNRSHTSPTPMANVKTWPG